MPTRLSRLLLVLERFAGRPLYPGLVAAVAAADYFVPGCPSNLVLAASVLPRPNRWRSIGVAFAVGCALGAFLLASVVASFGEPLLAWVQESSAAGAWQRIEELVHAYGLIAVGVLAFTPLPARIAVAVLALAGAAPLLLGGIVLAGRLVVYPAMAWAVARTPHLLLRIPPLGRALARVTRA